MTEKYQKHTVVKHYRKHGGDRGKLAIRNTHLFPHNGFNTSKNTASYSVVAFSEKILGWKKGLQRSFSDFVILNIKQLLIGLTIKFSQSEVV